MIVDSHVHLWETPDQLGNTELGGSIRARTVKSIRGKQTRLSFKTIPSADAEHHVETSEGVDVSIVWGYASKLLDAEIPNAFLARVCGESKGRLIGFAGVDPAAPKESRKAPSAVEQVRLAKEELGLAGIVLSPSGQGYHPSDSRCMRVLEAAAELGMVVGLHPVGPFSAQAHLEYSRPFLWDEPLRSVPGLKLIIGGMGWPFVDETMCLLAKHLTCYADTAGLLASTYKAHQILVETYQRNLMDKVLFGSDYPYMTSKSAIATLYSLNSTVLGTELPVVPREALRGMIERDVPTVLGIVRPSADKSEATAENATKDEK